MSGKSLKDALQTVNNLSKDVSVSKAVILASNPLTAQLLNDEKVILNSRLLVLPKHLTNYTTTIRIDSEEKQITVYNSLKAGDTVYLLGYNKGKKFLVLGRV